MARTVAIVANSAWNLWNFRRGLIAALRERGDAVLLVAPDGPERDKLVTSGVVFYPLDNLRRRGINPLRDLALLRELTGIYREHGVTHTLHFTIKPAIYGSLAARRAGAANVATLTGLGYTFIAGGWTTRLIRRLYRFALRDAHRVFFHNQDDRHLFLERGLCTTEQATVVGGSGLRLADFPVVDYSQADPNRILFAGRLLVDKGLRDYAAAAAICRRKKPALSFHVVGPFDAGNPAAVSPAELDNWVAAEDIIYDGETDDIGTHLSAATLVVLPSYREGCPRVLLEAAATGRVLVGTDVPGVRAVVRENGLLVPPESPEELAEAVLEILAEDESRRLARVVAGRTLVEDHFSEKAVVAMYLAATE